jgi:hypothetical protein
MGLKKTKKTPCEKCGEFDFDSRFHAICEGEGYLDENGEYVETNSAVDEVTQMHDITCSNCGETPPCFQCDYDEDEEDEDE